MFKSFDAEGVNALIMEGWDLKQRLDENVDGDYYNPEYHLARRYKEVKDTLAEIQQSEQLTNIPYGNLVFTLRQVHGRESVDAKKLAEELVFRGVDARVVADSIKASSRRGADYWVKEIKQKGEKD